MSTLMISAAAYAEIQAALKALALEAAIQPGQLVMDDVVLVWNGEANCTLPLFGSGLNEPGGYPIG